MILSCGRLQEDVGFVGRNAASSDYSAFDETEYVLVAISISSPLSEPSTTLSESRSSNLPLESVADYSTSTKGNDLTEWCVEREYLQMRMRRRVEG